MVTMRVTAAAICAVAAGMLVSCSTTSTPSSTPTPSKAHVVRVEIDVPSDFLTLSVARGTVLALHLHLKTGPPQSSWTEGRYVGPDQNFAPVRVPYPGVPATSSASDFYIAYSIRGLGTTHIGIGIPASCPGSSKCSAPEEFITVHAGTG
jgi:hypothetical protein